MRYFVYKDSQILGPFAREELGQAGNLRADTLLCEENLSGRRDSDWRVLKDIPELSETRVLEPAFFDEAPPGLGPGGLERLELDSLGVPEDDEQGAQWIRSLFEDADFRNRFAGFFPQGADDPQQLSLARSRIAELTGEVEALRARLDAVEKVRDVQWRTVELPRVLESVASLPPVMEPPAPPPPEMEKMSAPAAVPAPIPLAEVAEVTEAPPPTPSFPAVVAPIHVAPPEPPAHLFPASTPLAGLTAEPLMSGFKLNIVGSGGLRAIDEPPPLPSSEENEFSIPAATARIGIPPPPNVEVPKVGPAFDWPEPVAAMPVVVPEAQAVPSVPMAPAQEAAVAPVAEHPIAEEMSLPPDDNLIELQPPAPIAVEMAPEASSLQPVPVPALPLTAVFGSGSASPTFAPSGAEQPQFSSGLIENSVDLGPGVSAEASVADIVARLAKPAPTQAPTQKPPRRLGHLTLAAFFLLTAAVAAAFFLFLRNPKDLKTMVSMGSDQKPLGAEAPEEAPLAARVPASALQAPAVPAAPVSTGISALPATSAPVASAATAPPAAAAAPEAGDAAIALVKGFPLDGDRGTVGQWLQYSFAANPGDGNKEEWTAGAVDAATYLVQYQVNPGKGSSLSQSINYVFEADVQRKTIRGNSPNARELLAGGEPAAAKKPRAPVHSIHKKKRKKKLLVARRPKPKPRAKAVAQKPLSLLPLPTDSELMPPAEDDSTFQDATVLPQQGQ